jgi:predicted HicB family RNase H-like nuclease
MADRKVKSFIRGVTPELKAAIAAAVEEQGTTMNDLLIGILAAHFRVPFEPVGGRVVKVGPSTQLNLPMPERLRTRIRVAAARAGSTQHDVVNEILSEHFGVVFVPGARARRNVV